MNVAIEIIQKENIDNFLSITRQEKLKQQLSELDFKYSTGQRILPDSERAESESMNDRLAYDKRQEERSNYSTAELRAYDESNFAYFE